jgi:hypothetical protein
MKRWLPAVAFGAVLLTGGCVHTVKVEPIKVEPIYVTMDIYLKIDQELENFFSFEKTPQQGTQEKTESKTAPEGK